HDGFTSVHAYPGDRRTATAILDGRQQPYCPPGTLRGPGHDANRDTRPPRDTACGITNRDVGVPPHNVSVHSLELSPDIHSHELPVRGGKEDRREDDQTHDTCPDTAERFRKRSLLGCRDNIGHSLVTLLRREKRDHIGGKSLLLGIRRQYLLVVPQRFVPRRNLLPGIGTVNGRLTRGG